MRKAFLKNVIIIALILLTFCVAGEIPMQSPFQDASGNIYSHRWHIDTTTDDIGKTYPIYSVFLSLPKEIKNINAIRFVRREGDRHYEIPFDIEILDKEDFEDKKDWFGGDTIRDLFEKVQNVVKDEVVYGATPTGMYESKEENIIFVSFILTSSKSMSSQFYLYYSENDISAPQYSKGNSIKVDMFTPDSYSITAKNYNALVENHAITLFDKNKKLISEKQGLNKLYYKRPNFIQKMRDLFNSPHKSLLRKSTSISAEEKNSYIRIVTQTPGDTVSINTDLLFFKNTDQFYTKTTVFFHNDMEICFSILNTFNEEKSMISFSPDSKALPSFGPCSDFLKEKAPECPLFEPQFGTLWGWSSSSFSITGEVYEIDSTRFLRSRQPTLFLYNKNLPIIYREFNSKSSHGAAIVMAKLEFDNPPTCYEFSEDEEITFFTRYKIHAKKNNIENVLEDDYFYYLNEPLLEIVNKVEFNSNSQWVHEKKGCGSYCIRTYECESEKCIDNVCLDSDNCYIPDLEKCIAKNTRYASYVCYKDGTYEKEVFDIEKKLCGEPCESTSLCNKGLICSEGFCKYSEDTCIKDENQCVFEGIDPDNKEYFCMAGQYEKRFSAGQNCDENIQCAPSLSCKSNTCGKKSGSSCEKAEECLSQHCNNNICCEKGKTCCVKSNDCKEGYKCSQTNYTCYYPYGNNCMKKNRLYSTGQVSGNNYCFNGQWFSRSAAEEECEQTYECLSRLECEDGLCKYSTGQSCESHTQCISNHCQVICCEKGKTCCRSRADCVTNELCDFNDFTCYNPCGNGVCDDNECNACPNDCNVTTCSNNNVCDIVVGETCDNSLDCMCNPEVSLDMSQYNNIIAGKEIKIKAKLKNNGNTECTYNVALNIPELDIYLNNVKKVHKKSNTLVEFTFIPEKSINNAQLEIVAESQFNTKAVSTNENELVVHDPTVFDTALFQGLYQFKEIFEIMMAIITITGALFGLQKLRGNKPKNQITYTKYPSYAYATQQYYNPSSRQIWRR